MKRIVDSTCKSEQEVQKIKSKQIPLCKHVMIRWPGSWHPFISHIRDIEATRNPDKSTCRLLPRCCWNPRQQRAGLIPKKSRLVETKSLRHFFEDLERNPSTITAGGRYGGSVLSRGLHQAGGPPGLVRGPPIINGTNGGVPEKQEEHASTTNNVSPKFCGLHVPKACMGLD
jgi:hypothetical protein